MNDTTTQAPQPAPETDAGQAKPAKKKASWFRTILWMLSMVVLLNIVMAIIAYILHKLQVF